MAMKGGRSCAAETRRRAQSAPAAFGIGLVGFLESLGRAHHAVLVVTAFLIAGLIDRVEHFLAELGRVGEHVFQKVAREVTELRQIRLLIDFEQLVHEETVILQRRAIGWHGLALLALNRLIGGRLTPVEWGVGRRTH